MKNEPTVEKWRDEIYNAICLVNLTDRVGEGIKKVIEVFKKYQAHSVQEAREEERTRNFDLFDEILEEAWQDRESAEDPEDPRARVIYLKQELKRYRDLLATIKKEDGEVSKHPTPEQYIDYLKDQ